MPGVFLSRHKQWLTINPQRYTIILVIFMHIFGDAQRAPRGVAIS